MTVSPSRSYAPRSIESYVEYVEVLPVSKRHPHGGMMLFLANEDVRSITIDAIMPLECDDLIRAYWKEVDVVSEKGANTPLEALREYTERAFKGKHFNHQVHRIEKIRHGEVIWTYINECAFP